MPVPGTALKAHGFSGRQEAQRGVDLGREPVTEKEVQGECSQQDGLCLSLRWGQRKGDKSPGFLPSSPFSLPPHPPREQSLLHVCSTRSV